MIFYYSILSLCFYKFQSYSLLINYLVKIFFINIEKTNNIVKMNKVNKSKELKIIKISFKLSVSFYEIS
jgi:hypothetical protein